MRKSESVSRRSCVIGGRRRINDDGGSTGTSSNWTDEGTQSTGSKGPPKIRHRRVPGPGKARSQSADAVVDVQAPEAFGLRKKIDPLEDSD